MPLRSALLYHNYINSSDADTQIFFVMIKLYYITFKFNTFCSMKRILVHTIPGIIITLALACYECSTSMHTRNNNYLHGAWSPDPALEEKILHMDPERITEMDVIDVLSRSPAPRIISINGSIPIVTMDSFSRFLINMGYPEEQVRNPANGDLSFSSYTDSEELAGTVAWYYENEGMMPILIGHSQGGMLVVKTLHELAGAFHSRLRVWNPLTGKPEDRYTINEPGTARKHDVIGLRPGYASATATGRLMRIIMGQWGMLSRLREIPDTVVEFTGIHIANDLIAGNLSELSERDKYHPLGSALVHNVMLPSGYSHIRIPLTDHLAQNRLAREWIYKYTPQAGENPLPVELSGRDSENILFAAEQWFYIRKYWCLELQRFILNKK